MISVHDLNKAIGHISVVCFSSNVTQLVFLYAGRSNVHIYLGVSKETKLCKLRISLAPARQTEWWGQG